MSVTNMVHRIGPNKKSRHRAYKVLGAVGAIGGAAYGAKRFKLGSRFMGSSVGKRAAGYAKTAAGSSFGKRAAGYARTAAGSSFGKRAGGYLSRASGLFKRAKSLVARRGTRTLSRGAIKVTRAGYAKTGGFLMSAARKAARFI